MSGKVDVKVEGPSQSKVTFTGNTALVFGFQAIRLVFDKGHFVEAKLVGATEVGAKGIGEEAEPEMLETDSPFTPVFIEPDV
jgi:hypothetical protein